MNVKDCLVVARAKIENRKHWTTGALARDKHGHEVEDPKSERACRFCAIGAVRAACEGDVTTLIDARAALDTVTFQYFGRGSIVRLNDNESVSRGKAHEEVLKAFDLAIERVSK